MTFATGFLVAPSTTSSQIKEAWKQSSARKNYYSLNNSTFSSWYSSSESCQLSYPCFYSHVHNLGKIGLSLQYVVACISSSTSRPTRLYVSGLSFRTTCESLQNAFQNFGQLVEVNLVMDKIANRPRGFAFLRYETEEEAKNAIEGMHGKFLDGRVIFVEVAKPRSAMGKNQHNVRDSQH